MANKSINTLDTTSTLANADLLVLWKASANAAYSISGQDFTTMLTALAAGHGGIASIAKTGTAGLVDTYTITYADASTSTFTVTNGAKGDTGDQTYVYIRYADENPTSDADMGIVPADWMGIYAGLEDDPDNLHYTDYTWYEIKGAKGDTGDSIDQIRKTGTSGLTDIYTVTTNTGIDVGTFTVTNGQGGVSTVSGLSPDGEGDVKTIVNTVEDLGLAVGSATISAAFSALTANQMLICPATDFANAQLPMNGVAYVTTGTVEMFKGDSSTVGWITLHGDGTYPNYSMSLSSGYPSGTWYPDRWNLVWTNANPSSSFTAQTVPINLAGYTEVKVVTKMSLSISGNHQSTVGEIDECTNQIRVFGETSSSNSLVMNFRTFSAASTGVTFSGGNIKHTADAESATADNARLIPLYIYAR